MTGSERLPGIESGGHNACKPDDPDFHGELVLPPEYTPSSVRSGQIPAEIVVVEPYGEWCAVPICK